MTAYRGSQDTASLFFAYALDLSRQHHAPAALSTLQIENEVRWAPAQC